MKQIEMKFNVLILIALLCEAVLTGSRVKRHLVFERGSRLFFSVNVRDNLFHYSDFFAHVFGFKIDWDLPDSIIHSSKERLQRRDLYRGLENVLYHYNYNGTSCIQKFTCEASTLLPRSKHFLAQFYEIMFLSNNEGMANISFSQNECEEMFETCPLSLDGLIFISNLKSGY